MHSNQIFSGWVQIHGKKLFKKCRQIKQRKILEAKNERFKVKIVLFSIAEMLRIIPTNTTTAGIEPTTSRFTTSA